MYHNLVTLLHFFALLYLNQSTSASPSVVIASKKHQFRDSLWGCCNAGPFHPSLWLSCCCPPLAAAQFVHRVKWIKVSSPNFFARMVFMCGVYAITRMLCIIAVTLTDPNLDKQFHDKTDFIEPGWIYHIAAHLDSALAYLMWILTGLWLWRLRWRTRQQDRISGHCSEDMCCSFACPGLVTSQLLRHTTDYGQVSGRCCTRTGLDG